MLSWIERCPIYSAMESLFYSQNIFFQCNSFLRVTNLYLILFHPAFDREEIDCWSKIKWNISRLDQSEKDSSIIELQWEFELRGSIEKIVHVLFIIKWGIFYSSFLKIFLNEFSWSLYVFWFSKLCTLFIPELFVLTIKVPLSNMWLFPKITQLYRNN